MAALAGPRRWAYRAFVTLPGPVRAVGETVLRLRAERAVRSQPNFHRAGTRLLIGPANTAGQGWAWARAVERHLPGVSGLSLSVADASGSPGLAFPHDVWLTRSMQLRALAAHRQRMLGATHVISESARPELGDFFSGSLLADLPTLRRAGIAAAVLLHGSEARDPAAHAGLYPHSPFRGDPDDYQRRLQALVARTRATLEAAGCPVLVSTPDLLDFVPGATWLPLVVDVDAFATDAPVLERDRPVVLHAPSNPRLKGTAAIEATLTDLDSRGLLTYRRLQGVPHAEMAAAIAESDVLVDQVVLGNPGVLLAESLAAGRVVVAHLSEQVRDRMALGDPDGRPAPVVQADPTTIGQLIEQVVDDRTAYREMAAQGPGWARRNHDGRRAAEVLAGFLGHRPESSFGGSVPP